MGMYKDIEINCWGLFADSAVEYDSPRKGDGTMFWGYGDNLVRLYRLFHDTLTGNGPS